MGRGVVPNVEPNRLNAQHNRANAARYCLKKGFVAACHGKHGSIAFLAKVYGRVMKLNYATEDDRPAWIARHPKR